MQKLTATLRTIKDIYPERSSTHAYTAGSASDKMKVRESMPQITITTKRPGIFPAAAICLNYTGEALAVSPAAQMIHNANSDCHQIVICTDTLFTTSFPQVGSRLCKVAVRK